MRVPPLDDRTLELLEYPAVVERLSQLTSFSAGREAALALRPVVDRPRVVRRQRITAEVVHLSRLGAEVSLAGARDVRPLAERAERGQVLAARELLDIADAARSAGNVRRTLVRLAPDAPLLGTIGGRIGDLGPLGSLIGQAISGRGEVLDEASPELGRIRRAVAAAHDQLQQRMQAMAQSPALRGVLQEPIVTIRDGRYVLPVRAESRGALRGVVHDRSASGATIYVEPLAVVDLGNRWRELQVQERHEVERVLRELSQVVGETEPEITGAVDRLAEVDLAMAKGRLARELRALDLHERGAQGWLGEAPGELQLLGARHPLLTGDVVANTIAIGESDRVLLITGPNTGGKTVALKTAGLLVLMAQAGLPVPADRGSHVPIYESVFADIGDEQSIEQSLSTFSGHITAVISVLERADERSLVLLDELGAGTDPTEGAALGIAIVDRLLASGASLIATTHHSELKLYAHRTGSVQNASMEFDLGSLTPTYRLTMGLPGQSNALAIAERLGMPNEVIELARSGLSGEERQLETVLGELRAQLAAAERRAVAAADDAERARRLRREREQELDSLAGESMRLREEARIRIRNELSDVRRLLQRSRREIEAARLAQAAEDFRRAEEAADRLREEAAGSESGGSDPAGDGPARGELVGPAAVAHGSADPETRAGETADELSAIADHELAIWPGATVWLRGVSVPGEALGYPDQRGDFEVQLGALRTRVRVEQVRATAEHGAQTDERPRLPPAPWSPSEIEIRGQRLDEAVPLVEQFLDAASRSGHGHVRVIHGRGTGTLRRAVRDLFDRHPLVTAHQPAESREGGEGVTVVTLIPTNR